MIQLSQLIELAEDFPSASSIDLSPMTICLILSAASLLEDDAMWQGAGEDLTESELEFIHDIVATMQSEVSA